VILKCNKGDITDEISYRCYKSCKKGRESKNIKYCEVNEKPKTFYGKAEEDNGICENLNWAGNHESFLVLDLIWIEKKLTTELSNLLEGIGK